MKHTAAWKPIVSALVLAWAITYLIPWKDTPFETYVKAEATAHLGELDQLLARAHEKRAELDEQRQTEWKAAVAEAEAKGARVPGEPGKTSLFVGLSTVLKEDRLPPAEEGGVGERYDLAKFFPHIKLTSYKNVEKRNDALLLHLLKSSKSAIKPGLDLAGGVSITYQLNPETLAEQEGMKENQIEQAVSIIRSRVDAFGVAEPVVRFKPPDSIEVQLPGLTTRDHPGMIDTLAKPAKLEFSEVHRRQRPASLEDEPPPGYILKVEKDEDRETGEVIERLEFVQEVPIMSGDIIKKATPLPDEYGRPYVHMDFTFEGGRIFGEETGRMTEENAATGTTGRLAIILDGKLMSSPTVQQRLDGGSAIITGTFSEREVTDLANVLNNPLKVELEQTEVYEVEASLAGESKQASINAGLLGAGLVVVFMIIYYFFAGIVAVISLSVNIAIVIGALASFGASITLPGVAALVLTIGMAVDAQILIYERIREELNAGKTLKTSLVAGYQKAFSTILDANVTTLITAVILIKLGTGPVKGFGVTLAVGILASMFCALVVTRFLLDLLVNTGAVKKMMTVSLFKERRKIPFLNWRKPAFATSWCVVLVGVVGIVMNWGTMWGIDFLGGDEVTVNFDQRPSIAQVEQVAAAGGFGEVQVTYLNIVGGGGEFMKVQTEFEKGAPFFDALVKALPEAGLEQAGVTQIGPSVGAEVKRTAIIAVLVALVGILLYVALRFEIGYGIGAVAATVHDVAMTIGLYVLLGGQFSAPMVAAILMIVGYSINDTIVVFDRIREELDLDPSSSLKDVVNKAINLTLSRTILTSLTTMLATLALYIFAAGVVVDFALVFIIGILTGTFSSIFIASPIFYWWHKGSRKHVEETHDILPKYEWDAGSKASR